MKVKALILIITILHLGSCKNYNEQIVSVGYYIKELDAKPILYNFINNTDTIRIFTNSSEIKVTPEMIESIDVIKDRKANKNYNGFENYGVISMTIKNEFWQKFLQDKEHIPTMKLNEALIKDTIYLSEKHKHVSFKANNLIVRDKNRLYKQTNIGFLNKANKPTSVRDVIKIDKEKLKSMAASNLKIHPHQKPIYKLVYDVDSNKIIWVINATKTMRDGQLNRYGGKAFTNNKGLNTVETIEIDAIDGAVLKNVINEDVEIRIR